ncbi:MAG: DUF3788 domain-containing protein [Methanimicrococcus sp.]|nr:DUF3788 domain-containing protein [Methanimicrococcus sp.]
MDNYENLRLRDPEVTPTDEVLEQTLGGSYTAYTAFRDSPAGFGIEQEWKYYTDGKAWFAKGLRKWTTPRGAKKEKTVYWLSAWDGYFRVTIYFKEKNRQEVQKTEVGDKTKQIIAEAKTMGKLMTFPLIFDIRTADLPADIGALIECKKRIEG